MKKLFAVLAGIMLISITLFLYGITYDDDLQICWYWGAAPGPVHHYNFYIAVADSEAELNNASFFKIGETTSASSPTSESPFCFTGEAHKHYRAEVEAEDATGITGPMSEPSDVCMCAPGDVTRDGYVDIDDFALVMRHWGETGNVPGDLTNDGWVELDDFALIMRYWGEVYYNAAPYLVGMTAEAGQMDFKVVFESRDTLNILIQAKNAKQVNALAFILQLDPCTELIEIKKGSGLIHNNAIALKAVDEEAKKVLLGGIFKHTISGTHNFASVRVKVNPDIQEIAIISLKRIIMQGKNSHSFYSLTKEIPLKPQWYRVFQNFPNPPNPETWIPYQLARDANVKIEIRTITGQVLRTLELGNKSAGFYIDKGRAAHWDGMNENGEPVASGVYFYTTQFIDSNTDVIFHMSTMKMALVK